ncbi:hypothetical protein AAVH_41734, partial [Aphelenchoides avenae]
MRLVILDLLVPAVVAKCPPGSAQGRQPYDCYAYQTQIADWNTANAKCIALNGILTSLKSPLESLLVNSLVNKTLGRYWIGKGHYTGWADDNYTNWAK